MKNPLLVPELREMLASNRIDEIRDFSTFTPPEAAAEFLAALDVDEQRDILRILGPDTSAPVFAAFDDEVKLALLEKVSEDEAVQLLTSLPEETRDSFLERVAPEPRARMRERFRRTGSFQVQPLLAAIDEAAAPAPAPEELSAEEIAAEVNQHLESFRFKGGKVERVPRPVRGCWVRIVNPSKENLPLIAEHFKVPIDFLTASLDVDETARIETEDQATLFIVKIPYYDENSVDVFYFTIPVGIIMVNGLILTVCPREANILQDFADNKVRNIASGHRFILQVILRATVRYLQYLKQLNNAANIIQKKLELESRNKQLIKLFNIEKSLVYFTTSLKSNILMLERLRRLRVLDLNEANDSLLEDIFTECKQAIDMANIYSDILSGMMDAFASVISNNLNIVMRLLTSITIVITIPVVVTGFYGMNVALPLQNHPHAFLLVIALSSLLSGSAVFYFVKRRWLEP